MKILKSVTVSLLILGLSSIASAKVSVFTSSDAMRKALASKELKQLESRHGELVEVSLESKKSKGMLNEFTFMATLESNSPIGRRNCRVNISVASKLVKHVSTGITSAVLSEAVLSGVVCQK